MASGAAQGVDDTGVESNSRLTATVAAVLVALILAVGVTLLNVRGYIDVHVFIGMLLIPPVLVKVGSTGWRFARYLRRIPALPEEGSPASSAAGARAAARRPDGHARRVRSGPDPHPRLRPQLLFLHQASFFGWLAGTAIHLLGHFKETARLAPLDLTRRTRAQVAGASARQWTVAVALAVGVGVVLGLVMLTTTAHYLDATVRYIHHHHHH